MMMLSEIARAVNGKLLGADVLCTSVGINSKNIEKNQLFIGIKGERFDGNTFALDAISAGAAASLISDKTISVTPSVLVNDTRQAMGSLAHYWRNKFDYPLVAVTGSNGKTTTKEMIASILRSACDSADGVLVTEGNLNNDIGVPLTLFKLRDNHRFAVVEMGMNHEGEIDYLTHLTLPKIAVVTNAGTAHIGELGSRAAIARAKGEIYSGLGDGGVAIVNVDDDFASYWLGLNAKRKVITFGLESKADISANVVKQTEGCQQIQLKTPLGEAPIQLNILGVHNVYNALAAAAVAFALDVSLSSIVQGLERFGGVTGRLSIKSGLNGSLVIDDTYNANPDSMKAAIDVLAEQPGTQIFVMGDMAELGSDADKLHAEIGAYAKQKGVTGFFGLGENSRYAVQAFGESATHCKDVQQLYAMLEPMVSRGVTVLVKGSRFMKMERVVNLIVKETMEGAH